MRPESNEGGRGLPYGSPLGEFAAKKRDSPRGSGHHTPFEHVREGLEFPEVLQVLGVFLVFLHYAPPFGLAWQQS